LPIEAIVVFVNLVENFFAIAAGMLVSPPVIDGITQTRKTLLFNGLAKREVSFTPMGTQLDDQPRLNRGDQVIRKGEVTRPAANIPRLVAAWEEPGRWQAEAGFRRFGLFYLQDGTTSQ